VRLFGALYTLNTALPIEAVIEPVSTIEPPRYTSKDSSMIDPIVAPDPQAGVGEQHCDEIIDRIDFKEIPTKVAYSLTPFGRSLAKALGPLCQWGTDHMLTVERISEHRTTALAQPQYSRNG